MIDVKVKDVISCCPFVPIVTLSREGIPHTIIAGAVSQILDEEDVLVFNAYKMINTSNNLQNNNFMQVALAFRGDCPQNCKGLRLNGCGKIENGKLYFKIKEIDSMV